MLKAQNVPLVMAYITAKSEEKTLYYISAQVLATYGIS
jgi:hypothetical protein